MKIQGPDTTAKTSAARKSATGSSSKSGEFDKLIHTENEAPAHTRATSMIAGIDSLLLAQESEDPREKSSRKRMGKRAHDILKELDKIRLGMLTGTLSVGNLIDIADVVASHRERLQDAELSSLLDEIDLRAQIEIAKMRMALEASTIL